MKTIMLSLMLIMLPASAFCAELTAVKYLQKGDPLWYSEDGQTWQQGEFVFFITSPDCETVETRQDTDDYEQLIFSCNDDGSLIDSVQYYLNDSYEGFTINYVTGIKPGTPPPSKAELYGLLTRVENLINTNSIPSFFSTAGGLINDRIDMQRRVDVLRDTLKQTDID